MTPAHYGQPDRKFPVVFLRLPEEERKKRGRKKERVKEGRIKKERKGTPLCGVNKEKKRGM